jgi:hypothetical protein
MEKIVKKVFGRNAKYPCIRLSNRKKKEEKKKCVLEEDREEIVMG